MRVFFSFLTLIKNPKYLATFGLMMILLSACLYKEIAVSNRLSTLHLDHTQLEVQTQDEEIISSSAVVHFLKDPAQLLAFRWQGDPNVLFKVRVFENGIWSKWKEVGFDMDGILAKESDAIAFESLKEENRFDTEFLLTDNATAFQYQILVPNDQDNAQSLTQNQFSFKNYVQNLELNVIHDVEAVYPTDMAFAASNFSVQPRSAWGADENLIFREGWQKERDIYCKKSPTYCRPTSEAAQKQLNERQAQQERDFPDESTVVQSLTHQDGKELAWTQEKSASIKTLVVHHTAESFNDANAEEVEGMPTFTKEAYQARIRAIYYYHSIVRGWGDIGYNYIIDPLGNVYEGRAGGDKVVAGHVAWHNRSSLGISMMGNYEENTVPAQALDGLVQTLSYLSVRHRLEPERTISFFGKDIFTISAHRDLAATACPGKNLYALLPEIRKRVALLISNPNQEQRVITPILGSNNDANSEYSAEFIQDIKDITLSPTSTKDVILRFKNTGSETWDAQTQLEVCCSIDTTFYIEKTGKDNPKMVALMGEESVAPGQIATFPIRLQSGYLERVTLFTFTPIINGSHRVQSIIIPSEVSTPDYSYEFISSPYPKNKLFAGETSTTTLKLKNTGNIIWENSGENAILLRPDRPQGRKTAFQKNSTSVLGRMQESRVYPGEIATFNMEFIAPNISGMYQEYFTPHIRQVGYFEDKGMHFDFTVMGDASENLEYIHEQRPSQALIFTPNEKKKVYLTLTNKDARTWQHLTSGQLRAIGTDLFVFSNIQFDKDEVIPNDTVTLQFDVQAPDISRRFDLQVKLFFLDQNVFQKPLFLTTYVQAPIWKAQLVSLVAAENILSVGERMQIKLSFLNQGNIPWKKGEINLGKFNDRELGTKIYDSSWKGPLRPATLEEDIVYPGQIGTFQFYVTPSQSGIIDEFYRLGAPGGWVDMELIFLRFSVAQGGSQTPSVPLPTSKNPIEERASKNIRVKLSFPSQNATAQVSSNTATKILSGNTSFAAMKDTNIDVSFENNIVTVSSSSQKISGTSVRITPEKNGINTVRNWERFSAWDTDKKYNDNQFRGTLEFQVEDGKLIIINELPLEEYMYGIAEVPENNHPEKKKTMAILARTYALFYMGDIRKFPGKPYDGSDDPAIFQKYLGYGYEMRSPGFKAAVEQTKSMVVTYKGQLIKTPYFNQSDGKTKSAEEVWGWKDTPYLLSVDDPLCAEKIQRGHGVGLSGCGAEAAARAGQSYLNIIQYYYRGVEVKNVSQL